MHRVDIRGVASYHSSLYSPVSKILQFNSTSVYCLYTRLAYLYLLHLHSHDDDDSAITTSKLRRRPTPIKRGQRPSDRVKELKREGKTAISSGRTPSGSGYDSADSSTQMYRPAVEMHPLQKRTEL